MQALLSQMSTADTNSWTALAIDAAIKATVILLLTAVIAAMLHQASAAVRHRLWCLTFVGLLMLPLLSYALPAWQIPVLPPVEQTDLADVPSPAVAEQRAEPPIASEAFDAEPALHGPSHWPHELSLEFPEGDTSPLLPLEPGDIKLQQPLTAEFAVAAPTAAKPAISPLWALPFLTIWMTGGLLVIAPLIVGVLHSRWLGLRAAQVTDAGWTGLLHELSRRLQLRRRVKLLELRRPVIPMTWGVFRPVVVVPEMAQAWPERLRRFVLLHELAHVKRWDVPFQLLGRAACAMYWFHPLAWYALRQLRIERELACDDCVVTTGERPSDYAEQLVQIVRACRPAGLASVGVAMARNSHLEGRIRAMFDKARSHVPLSVRAARVLSLAAALLVTTVAVVRPAAREAERVVVDEAAAPDSESTTAEVKPTELAAAPDATAKPVPDDTAEEKIVRGIVLGPDGKPVAVESYSLADRPRHGNVRVLKSVTDADGRFRLFGTPNHADTSHAVAIRGKVVDPDGKPVSTAFVAVTADRFLPDDTRLRANAAAHNRLMARPLETDEEPTSGIEVLGQTTTDEMGEFELRLSGVSSRTHQSPHVIAWAEGRALAWHEINLDIPVFRATLTVEPEQPLELSLVDLEGQPAVGVRPAITDVMVRGVTQPRAWLTLPDSENISRKLFGNPTTDEYGRVTIRHIAQTQGIQIGIPGSDRFAPQWLALNTQQPEQRGPRDRTYRSLVKNSKPGETVVFPLAPAQIFAGRVLLGRGDQPAANSRISLWSSQHERGGSLVSVTGRTDDNGNFRLNPYPGVRYGIVAHPPEGLPFHGQMLDDLRWSSGEASKSIEIRLTPGVSVHGTVVDAKTGEPIEFATVQYEPDRVHNENLSDGLVFGWQGANPANEAGEFQMTVLPGPGTLMVHAPSGDYVLQAIGQRQVYSGDPGGVRLYAHAFERINIPAGDDARPLKFELQRGETVTGTLIDPDGKPVAHALMISRLRIDSTTPQWRGGSEPARDGTFKVQGLRPGTEYPLYFVDIRHRLGATARITAETPEPSVTLEPCGTATARFVDQDGHPIAEQSFGLQIVVTPGPPKLARVPDQGPELLADEDFYSNCLNSRMSPHITGARHELSMTDADGRVTYGLLIPGATYRLYRSGDRGLEVAAEFTVQSGETRDLGQITMKIDK